VRAGRTAPPRSLCIGSAGTQGGYSTFLRCDLVLLESMGRIPERLPCWLTEWELRVTPRVRLKLRTVHGPVQRT
jgi:hypothetical protein